MIARSDRVEWMGRSTREVKEGNERMMQKKRDLSDAEAITQPSFKLDRQAQKFAHGPEEAAPHSWHLECGAWTSPASPAGPDAVL